MIEYRLKKEDHEKNHSLDHKWASLFNSPLYKDHLCTVVDNHLEIKDNKYTGVPAKLLLHLTPNVRRYVRAKLFDNFLYVGIWHNKEVPDYTNWDYTYEKLGKDKVIEILTDIIYNVEPLLISKTCVGGKNDSILDESNVYSGEYVLNDENRYTIERKGAKVKFYRTYEGRYICFHTDTLDEEKLKKCIEKYNLKLKICKNTERLLATGEIEKLLKEYKSL